MHERHLRSRLEAALQDTPVVSTQVMRARARVTETTAVRLRSGVRFVERVAADAVRLPGVTGRWRFRPTYVLLDRDRL